LGRSKKVLRIGNAGGYWGDDLSALRRQLTGGPLDYVTQDFLAEITMSILHRQRRADPELGYAVDFFDQMRDCLPLLVRRKVRLVTNAGGINPIGLGRRLIEEARRQDLALKVGIVYGDDITERLYELSAAGERFTNLETDEDFFPVRSRISAANIYFGAEPVVQALEAGCQVVVTGRVTDTGISLAPMIHHFGWGMTDWDRLASGIVAAHIIECGAQASGGNITDWQEVGRFHDIGYPIIEMEESGEFTVTKHPATGGLVSEKTIKEQLVYEMGDPGRYISPDGVARFDTLQLRAAGRDQVRVSGVRGEPAPDSLKVSMAYEDGWKATGEILVSGPDIQRKAAAIAEAFWNRLGLSFEHTHTGLVGAGAAWPASMVQCDPTEGLLQFGVRDHDQGKVRQFGKTLSTLILSGPAGMAVTTRGRPRPQRVVAYWPALIHRSRVAAKVLTIATSGQEEFYEVPFPVRVQSLATGPPPAAPPAPPRPSGRARRRQGRQRVVRLQEIAFARSGDKGDTCNIGVLARSPAIYDWLLAHLTTERVARFFGDIVQGKVIRHELHNLHGLNFLLEHSLGGGGTTSLLVDPQGKTYAQALLQMRVRVPASLVP
jgi:hypothetical protein